MKNTVNKIYFISFFLLFLSCDVDRYFGYNHEAEEQLESTNIFGSITNIFTGETVDKANIHIGNILTQSDSEGEYFTKYPLQEDENRDAPVSILIQVPKYYDFEEEVRIYPLNNEFNFELVYGAPIVLNSTLGTPYPDYISAFLMPPFWCQALMRDYQGIETIVKLTSAVYFSNDKENPVEYELELHKKINETDAYYQVMIPGYVQGYGQLQYAGSYTIRAYDNEGFVEVYSAGIEPARLLFAPR